MSKLISEAMKAALLWRIAVTRFVLYSVASLWTCWATATGMVNMLEMDAWTWFQTIGGCLASWCLVIIAYLDKSAHQISAGELPGLDINTPGPSHDPAPDIRESKP